MRLDSSACAGPWIKNKKRLTSNTTFVRKSPPQDLFITDLEWMTPLPFETDAQVIFPYEESSTNEN